MEGRDARKFVFSRKNSECVARVTSGRKVIGRLALCRTLSDGDDTQPGNTHKTPIERASNVLTRVRGRVRGGTKYHCGQPGVGEWGTN
jgi:hypothetical protein